MEKIVIYGLGNAFESLIVKNYKWWVSHFEIVALCDKRAEEDSIVRILDQVIPCIKPAELQEWEYDSVYVTTTKYYNDIQDELVKLGISKEKIHTAYRAVWMLEYNLCNTLNKCLEIGGPSSIFNPIYDLANVLDMVNFSRDNIWDKNEMWKGDTFLYEGEEIGRLFIREATDLYGIQDQTYDLICSSNVLEHVANPLAALLEQKRILKEGGYLILVVPNKEYGFDHDREDVTFSHLIDDYRNQTPETDMTHLEEILSKHDLSLDKAAGTFEMFKERSLHNFENRCLHHHVFSAPVLLEIAEFLEMEMVGNVNSAINHIILMKRRKDSN